MVSPTSPKTTPDSAAKSAEPSVHSPSSPTKDHPVVTTCSGRVLRLPSKFQMTFISVLLFLNFRVVVLRWGGSSVATTSEFIHI